MKIGIITYHFARNYGAALQCFALQEYLDSLGHNVSVLDFFTDKQQSNNSLFDKRTGIRNTLLNIALIPFRHSRKAKEEKFVAFISERLKTTERLMTVEQLESYVKREKYDLLVSGSDQVFNPLVDDFNRAFMLPFSFPGTKASFAASLGAAGREELDTYKKELSDFDFLSVREKHSIDLVQSLSGKSVSQEHDPVFLLNAGAWRTSLDLSTKSGSGYVLLYYINKAPAATYLELAKTVAAKLNLSLKTINARFSKESFDKSMLLDVGPDDFVSLFNNASAVLTDSFHGTAFSLIFNKPFASFEAVNNSRDTRKTGLLEVVGEQNRSVCLRDEKCLAKILDAVTTIPENAQQTLSKMRENQEKYLDEVLKYASDLSRPYLEGAQTAE